MEKTLLSQNVRKMKLFFKVNQSSSIEKPCGVQHNSINKSPDLQVPKTRKDQEEQKKKDRAMGYR